MMACLSKSLFLRRAFYKDDTETRRKTEQERYLQSGNPASRGTLFCKYNVCVAVCCVRANVKTFVRNS